MQAIIATGAGAIDAIREYRSRNDYRPSLREAKTLYDQARYLNG